MIIDIEFSHNICDTPLLVAVAWPGGQTTLNLNELLPKLTINLDLPCCDQTVELLLQCADIKIVDYPLTITNITLDNFYSLPKILHSGSPTFDDYFISYAKMNNFFIDSSVNDVNRLDFTGVLTYKFLWPFYKNVWGV